VAYTSRPTASTSEASENEGTKDSAEVSNSQCSIPNVHSTRNRGRNRAQAAQGLGTHSRSQMQRSRAVQIGNRQLEIGNQEDP
jgi:hypothetical protein